MISEKIRDAVLTDALKAVNEDRNKQYGEPEDSFALIGALWTTYLGIGIDEEDVAQMMILLKIARNIGPQANVDNWIDIAGYAACGAACQAEALQEQEEKTEQFRERLSDISTQIQIDDIISESLKKIKDLGYSIETARSEHGITIDIEEDE